MALLERSPARDKVVGKVFVLLLLCHQGLLAGSGWHDIITLGRPMQQEGATLACSTVHGMRMCLWECGNDKAHTARETVRARS